MDVARVGLGRPCLILDVVQLVGKHDGPLVMLGFAPVEVVLLFLPGSATARSVASPPFRCVLSCMGLTYFQLSSRYSCRGTNSNRALSGVYLLAELGWTAAALWALR